VLPRSAIVLLDLSLHRLSMRLTPLGLLRVVRRRGPRLALALLVLVAAVQSLGSRVGVPTTRTIVIGKTRRHPYDDANERHRPDDDAEPACESTGPPGDSHPWIMSAAPPFRKAPARSGHAGYEPQKGRRGPSGTTSGGSRASPAGLSGRQQRDVSAGATVAYPARQRLQQRRREPWLPNALFCRVEAVHQPRG
jgi:hypothetical protein